MLEPLSKITQKSTINHFHNDLGRIPNRSGTDLGVIGSDLGVIWERFGNDLGAIWE